MGFKKGDRVVVYGAGMYWRKADGHAASRRLGVVEQGPDFDDLGDEGDAEYMTVKFDGGHSTVAVSPKQCRRIKKK